MRTYDDCHHLADRSAQIHQFDSVLLDIVGRELADRPDIVDPLKNSLVEPLDPNVCGEEPSLFTDFSEEFVNE